MPKKKVKDNRIHLAHKRTEMAHERTLLAYMRTSTTFILFGIAFIGFSQDKGDFFKWAGIVAILTGMVFLKVAVFSGLKHSKDLKKIKKFIDDVVDFD